MPRRILFSLLLALGVLSGTAARATPTFVTQWSISGIPHSVVVAPDGNVLVTDLNGHVEEFTSDGSPVRTWGTSGQGPGQFSYLYALTLSGTGTVLVTDSQTNRIEEFTRTGVFIREFGPGLLFDPQGLTVDAQGNIFVAEASSPPRISELTPSGTLIRRIVAPASVTQVQFTDVSVVGNEVYGMNGWGNVLVFTTFGLYLRQMGSFGQAPGQLAQPEGIGVGFGQVYVADTANNRVQRFTTSGTFIDAWGSFGFGPGQMYSPTDVVTAPNGRIYVADKFNNRIQVFQVDQTTSVARSTWGRVKQVYR